MDSENKIKQSFVIDKLTDSILNTISGDSFKTEISVLTKAAEFLVNKYFKVE